MSVKLILLTICIFLLLNSCDSHEQMIWGKNQISYYINREANQNTIEAIHYSLSIWESAINKRFNFQGYNEAGLIKDGKNTISFVTTWPPSIPDHHVAYCRKWYRFGFIVESDIIFNMSLVKFTTLKTNEEDSYMIEGVLLHEIGHLLGLSHINNEDSLMSQKFSVIKSRNLNIDNLTLSLYNSLTYQD